MECLDFDDSEQIIAARRRLLFLTKPGTEADEIIDFERCLDLEVSVTTVKASNSSSSLQTRDLEGHLWLWYESERDGKGQEHVVSPNSSILDVDGSFAFAFDEQDSLHFC